MEADRKMEVITTDQREKATATAGMEARTETFGIQAKCKMQLRHRTTTATMEASSNHQTVHIPQKHKSFQQ